MKKLILLSLLIGSIIVLIVSKDMQINTIMDKPLFTQEVDGRNLLLLFVFISAGYRIGYEDGMSAIRKANKSSTPFKK